VEYSHVQMSYRIRTFCVTDKISANQVYETLKMQNDTLHMQTEEENDIKLFYKIHNFISFNAVSFITSV